MEAVREGDAPGPVGPGGPEAGVPVATGPPLEAGPPAEAGAPVEAGPPVEAALSWERPSWDRLLEGWRRGDAEGAERDREGGERTGEVREEKGGAADSGGEREAGPGDVPATGRGGGGELGLDDLAVVPGDEGEDEEDKAKFGEVRPLGGDGSMSG